MSTAEAEGVAMSAAEADLVLYAQRDRVAVVTMNRPQYRNAQNAKLTFALDAAFQRAVADDGIGVIVLAGTGPHFSAGHDIGTPGRDVNKEFPRVATSFWPHADKPPTENLYVREAELYLGMCRRWRELPKPTIAMVQGACIAGGLALAWCCDLIVAADDAFFSDPVLKMGIPGVEYFAHPHMLRPRIAKELLFTGERLDAQRALQLGMINRVVPRAALEEETLAMGRRIAEMPRFALALAKQAVNHAEERMGLRESMDAAYGLHQLAHAHNALTSPDYLAGQSPKSMKGE
jgi:enoyl-CoA hydratase/carnithine racemase